ncbi:MAG: hypothetical protein AAF518_23525, partial [Spirochaetota bacterium]
MIKWFSVLFLFFYASFTYAGKDFVDFSKLASSLQLGNAPNSKIRSFLYWGQHILQPASYDTRTKEFYTFLSQSFKKFQFRKIYESKYLSAQGNGFKKITFSHKYSGKGYFTKIVRQNVKQMTAPHFGDAISEYALKKNQESALGEGTFSDSPTFSAYLKSKSNLGHFSDQTLLLLLENLLQIISPKNIEKLPQLGTKRFYNNLKTTTNRKLLDSFYKSYPHFSNYLQKYTSLSRLVYLKKYKGQLVTAFDLRGRLSDFFLYNDYPYAATFLRDLKSLGKLHIYFYTNEGHRFMELHLNSHDLSCNLQLYTLAGKLVPYLSSKKLFLEKSFSLSSLKSFYFPIHISFKGNIYGLTFKNNNIWLGAWYTNQKRHSSLKVKMASIPKTKVSGGFSYVIPSWLIDIMIPGNMEGLIHSVTTVIVNANNKRGSFVKTHFYRRDNTQIHTNLETEFLDNFFIRFGVKVWNYR